jgi:hypothetical protein
MRPPQKLCKTCGMPERWHSAELLAAHSTMGEAQRRSMAYRRQLASLAKLAQKARLAAK